MDGWMIQNPFSLQKSFIFSFSVNILFVESTLHQFSIRYCQPGLSILSFTLAGSPSPYFRFISFWSPILVSCCPQTVPVPVTHDPPVHPSRPGLHCPPTHPATRGGRGGGGRGGVRREDAPGGGEDVGEMVVPPARLELQS